MRCYANNPDNTEEMRYVFLPSYADAEHVEDAIRSADGINPQTGRGQTDAIMELVKKYSKYYKVKFGNIFGGRPDMVPELWVK